MKYSSLIKERMIFGSPSIYTIQINNKYKIRRIVDEKYNVLGFDLTNDYPGYSRLQDNTFTFRTLVDGTAYLYPKKLEFRKKIIREIEEIIFKYYFIYEERKKIGLILLKRNPIMNNYYKNENFSDFLLNKYNITPQK